MNTPVEKSHFPTNAFPLNTVKRNNFVTTEGHANINSGVPIIEGHSNSIQRPAADHENEWFVGGFDSSSNLSSAEQHHRHQQNASVNYGFANSVTPSISKAPSSNEIADEGMFDFEL